jgi:hypothetical protein
MCGGVFAAEHAAKADEPNVHDKAATAFLDARKLIEQGNCDAAVPKLRESLSYESSIGARLSIVDCLEPHDPLASWRMLKEASVLALMNHDDRLSVIEQRAALLQTHLATITFKLPLASEQPGFELRVDGDLIDRYVYRYGYATSAGRHVVEASSNGKRFAGAVNVDVGAQALVDVILKGDDCKTTPAPVLASAPTPAPIFDRGASRRTLGLALGGVGLASIANGVVFGLLTLDKKSTLESQCGGSIGTCNAPNRSLEPESEAARTTAAISTASFIIGGAALLGGVALYVTAPSSNAPRTGLRVGPGTVQGAF